MLLPEVIPLFGSSLTQPTVPSDKPHTLLPQTHTDTHTSAGFFCRSWLTTRANLRLAPEAPSIPASKAHRPSASDSLTAGRTRSEPPPNSTCVAVTHHFHHRYYVPPPVLPFGFSLRNQSADWPSPPPAPAGSRCVRVQQRLKLAPLAEPFLFNETSVRSQAGKTRRHKETRFSASLHRFAPPPPHSPYPAWLKPRACCGRPAPGRGSKRAAKGPEKPPSLSLSLTLSTRNSACGTRMGSSCAGALGPGMMLALGETVAWQCKGGGGGGTCRRAHG